MGVAAGMESQRCRAELGKPATDDGMAGNPNHGDPREEKKKERRE
jgi:hypothetical protein